MTKISILFLTILFSFSLLNCNNRMTGAADDSVQFYSKGYQIPFEVKIAVTDNNMELFYTGNEMQAPFSKTYSITDNEKDELFGYLKDINFLKMDIPEPEMRRDAPVTKLTAKLNGDSREIDIGQMSSVPDPLADLKTKMFNLASAYKPGWKKEVGFE
ncbi:MAG TPA: hypothetical protein VKD08_16085 [Ignavibacteriaceae bacterium]|nr:hypothetical protein [Ignavibacteriaceae bacterium]